MKGASKDFFCTDRVKEEIEKDDSLKTIRFEKEKPSEKE